MKIKSFVLVGSMAVLGVAFTSCSKGEELFDSGAQVAQQKSEYATNFEKKYGPIDPNQTWDFATMEPISTLPSTSYAGTRGVETPVSVELQSTGTMSVEQEIIDYMHENFKPGVNNVKKGTPFYLKTQEQTFTIVPFYQGVASYYWELWMNIGGKDVQIWSKNQSVEYKTADGKWHKLTGNNGIPDGAVEVKAPTYTYKATKDQSLYFFLKVWTGGTKSGNENKIASSLDKMMLALEGARKPANVPADNEVTIIGCEDNESGDNDYEDLVFMMYGKPTPPIIPTDEIEVPETKRYMMEDLGTTDDFDFNDIVVDVENVYTQKIYFRSLPNGGFEEDHRDPKVYKGQRAIVRAAGGTLDFTLTIGNTTWSKSDDLIADQMYNTGWGSSNIYRTGKESELAKFDVTGWVPDDNNISVTVVGQSGYNGVMTIKFPKKGEAPMMIAVDKKQEWMTERSSVPSSWWYKVD